MRDEPGHTDVDALLARLPQWTPPAGFAARLAAAAARQADHPAPVLSTLSWLLRRLATRAPMIAGSALLALALALVPWAQITFNPLFPWLFAAGSALLGSLMTLRLIRS